MSFMFITNKRAEDMANNMIEADRMTYAKRSIYGIPRFIHTEVIVAHANEVCG